MEPIDWNEMKTQVELQLFKACKVISQNLILEIQKMYETASRQLEIERNMMQTHDHRLLSDNESTNHAVTQGIEGATKFTPIQSSTESSSSNLLNDSITKTNEEVHQENNDNNKQVVSNNNSLGSFQNLSNNNTEPNNTSSCLEETADVLSSQQGLLRSHNRPTIYAVGGTAGWTAATSSVMTFSFDSRQWNYGTSMLQPRCDHEVAVLDNRVYAVGGFNGNKTTWKSGEVFDPVKNKWTFISKMNKPRSSFGLVSLQDKLYAIGGQDESMEHYDPLRDSWEIMQTKLKNKHFGITQWNGSIVICGGLDNKIQQLDTRQPNWLNLGECDNIQHCALVALNDCIYCIGGSKPDCGSVNAVKYFDMKMRSWQMVRFMESKRSELAAVEYEGNIIALGGYDKATMEEYFHETNQWNSMPPMLETRSSFGAVIIG